MNWASLAIHFGFNDLFLVSAAAVSVMMTGLLNFFSLFKVGVYKLTGSLQIFCLYNPAQLKVEKPTQST